ncbi:hypothetical protein [Mesorhizobium sp. M0140]|uniref:hypothetical protein n=1 Tax=Mesorhizobium sp. M0140 TaxID=2956893 RepID=UPI003339AEBE
MVMRAGLHAFSHYLPLHARFEAVDQQIERHCIKLVLFSRIEDGQFTARLFAIRLFSTNRSYA